MSAQNPAYKETWFWVVFSPLILVVFVCAALLKFAIVGGDDVVSDEYYKEGRMINNRFDSEYSAAQLDISGTVILDKNAQQLRLEVFGEQLPEKIIITLSHPAKQALDRNYSLQRVGPHQYVTQLSDIPSGRYYLLLEADTASTHRHWRLSSEMDFSSSTEADFGNAPGNALDLLN